MSETYTRNAVKPYACLTCRQRKIKCDRIDPCTHCIKSSKQCSYIAPMRGKRKVLKPRKEGTYAKLRRYEELLKSMGAELDATSVAEDETDVDMAEDLKSEMTGVWSEQTAPEETRPKFMIKDGSSRYFDTALWTGLGDESRHPEEATSSELADNSSIAETDALIFSPESGGLAVEGSLRSLDLVNLHISVQSLPLLRAAFIERVDPLVKILHNPTFWPSVTDTLQNPNLASKSLTALIFSVYLVVLSSLDEYEAQEMFGLAKSVAFTRYRYAARQALAQAGLLTASNPMILQAYSLYLMAVRSCYRSEALYILSGISIRLARKMGLHRDGTHLGLSPFETEKRRRLWWWIAQIDIRTSDVVGMNPSADIFSCNTKMPSNVEDEDLHPDMTDPPPERRGITDVVASRLRCHLIDFIQSISSPNDESVRMEKLATVDMSLAQKDELIKGFEEMMEETYLRFCDPTNSTHTLASVFIRSMVCRMRLIAHNPRLQANKDIASSAVERDIVFTNAIKLLDYINLMQESPIFAKFRWIMGTTYLWNTILCVLIEARHRKTGIEVDRLWQVIGKVYANYPAMFEENPEPIFTAMGRWTLEVWDEYVVATMSEGRLQPSTPAWIDKIRYCVRTARKGSRSRASTAPTPSDMPSTIQTPEDSMAHIPGFDDFASYDFSDLLSFEMNTNEWGRFM